MQVRDRVFVSSTTIDLASHRAAAVNSLRRMGFDVESMDTWPGDPSPPGEVSVRRVDGADLFVLLVAFRRGHVPEGQVLSITQQEYQRASSLGLDCLVFLLKEGTPWVGEFDERTRDPEVAQWRKQLSEDHTPSFFGLDPDTVEIGAMIAHWLRGRGRLQESQPTAPGMLQAQLAAGDENALHALVASFVRARPHFQEADVSALEVASLELFRNCEQHVVVNGPNDVVVTIEDIAEPWPGVAVRVDDRGRGFDFDNKIQELERELSDDGREHGLLRAARKGTLLEQVRLQPHAMWWGRTHRPLPEAPVFNAEVAVPVIFSWTQRSVRIWHDIYSFLEMDIHLTRSPAFIDLIFDPLLRPRLKWVGIEIVGMHGTVPLGWDPVVTLVNALLAYSAREPRFDKRFAMFLATEPDVHRRLRRLCTGRGIELFEDPRDARRFAG